MVSFIAVFSSVIISVSSFLGVFTPAGSTPVMASIFHFAGDTPTDLGVNSGSLKSCPDSPNCVVSQIDSSDEEHFIESLKYDIDREEAYDAFLKILSVVPDTIVIEEDGGYIRTESTSKLMGFVDDMEFYFPEDESVIHWRSASRLGQSDLGVNRRRLEQIRFAFNDFINS